MDELYTISELLVLEKKLKERKNQLIALTSEASVSRQRYFGDQVKEITNPTYSITDVEEVLYKVNMALLNIDQEIKRVNGITQTAITKTAISLAELLKPIKAVKSE